MEDITRLAESLGKAIAATPEFAELKRLELEARSDPELSRLTGEYQMQLRRIANLEKNQQPVEVEDKTKLTELREKVQSNVKIHKLLKVQTEYSALMNRINGVVTAPLQIRDENPPQD